MSSAVGVFGIAQAFAVRRSSWSEYFYMLAGSGNLAMARGATAFSPWAMGLPLRRPGMWRGSVLDGSARWSKSDLKHLGVDFYEGLARVIHERTAEHHGLAASHRDGWSSPFEGAMRADGWKLQQASSDAHEWD